MDEFGRIDIQFLRPDCAVVAVATTSMFAPILISDNNCYDHDVITESLMYWKACL